MIKLDFVVWEFVRLMVELEGAKGDQSIKDAYSTWQEPWQEIDERLSELGKNDAEGFADLMMDQTISVPCETANQLSQALAALGRVTTKLKAEIARIRNDDTREEELNFELDDLTDLADRLCAIDPAVLSVT